MALNVLKCHLFVNAIKLNAKSVGSVGIRSHFKFSRQQLKQQTSVISKMVNRNEDLITKLMQNRPQIISKGSPNRRNTSNEDNKTSHEINDKVMTRRMIVLNKQLMQSISDILSTEPIGQELEALKVHITQVRVNKRCDSANVFWISKSDETERVAKMLDQMKGRLRHHVMDRHLMHSVPWIQFVLDVTENHSLEVDRVLKTCDFGPDFKPFDETMFETPYERVGRKDGKIITNQSEESIENMDGIYEYMKLKKPNDMQMNCLGLNYELIINIVLSNLKKSRAQHRCFNAVADPLPPPDWSEPTPNSVGSESDAFYNTDERIKKRVFDCDNGFIPLSSMSSTSQMHTNSPKKKNRAEGYVIYNDKYLYSRVKELLTSTEICDNQTIVNHLQKTFPEYKRKKKSALLRCVDKALEVLNKDLSTSDDNEDHESVDSLDVILESRPPEEPNLLNKSMNDLYSNKSMHSVNNTPKNSENLRHNKVSERTVRSATNRRTETETNSKADRSIDVLLTKQVQLKERFLVEPKLTFDDFGGIDGVVVEIKKLMFHLRHPTLYTTIGVEPPRGFLLHGPPGVGKSAIVEAIANDLHIPYLRCGATEIVAGISGESEAKIRELFSLAQSMKPCILFIDEIDSITPKRDNASKEMERRIVTQLLTSLDGLGNSDSEGVMVIGATNRPDAIDPALRRAGRFDREISLGIPDKKARNEILRVLCRKVKLTEDFDFVSLAHKTPGYVGADLKSLIRESAINALERILLLKEIDINSSFDSNSLNIEDITSLLTIEMNDFEIALKQIQPSSKREGFATVPDVTWDDVGALDSVRKDLQLSILAPIKYEHDVKALGLSTSVGILLCGPPGCGKTLLAKAIANESGINFISVKGPELLNMYVGESERAVRSVFIRARNSRPCVVFFDEIDALCPKRSDSESSNASSRVVNQLLTEMDGLESRNCFLLAATNRPDIIDPAILRPGRFDKILYVGFPSNTDRFEILKTLSKNGTKPPLSPDVDLEAVAKDKRLDGMTGADLHSLLRESCLSALSERISGQIKSDVPIVVNSHHMESALSKVKPSVNDSERRMYEKMHSIHGLKH
ncbi:unnamed protein product [Medioppia subpectinata]|uniref:AAA+ ATPase domain-containing protein n=1 Tax=Medioppia subpectinata TaxID=1979941 RepID=A0A7R9KCS6_9ACAR|nr:unnamed protein product [Medioppia subpectinata]CAG2100250.1 unnamed protein product [Medioppia subpectinata]